MVSGNDWGVCVQYSLLLMFVHLLHLNGLDSELWGAMLGLHIMSLTIIEC